MGAVLTGAVPLDPARLAVGGRDIRGSRAVVTDATIKLERCR